MGAVVKSAWLRGAVLAFDRIIMLRMSVRSTASFGDIVQCLQGEQPGLRWQVLEGGNDGCSSATIFNPLNGKVPSRSQGGSSTTCEKEYATNPWACDLGDWSGKFGTLDLGFNMFLGIMEDKAFMSQVNGRSLEAIESRDRIYKGQIRVFEDATGIPPCQLEGKLLGFYCADGRLAACSTFERVVPLQRSRASAMEAALTFMVVEGGPTHCGNNTESINGKQEAGHRQPPPGWSNAINSWLGDVKSWGREAWHSAAEKMSNLD